MDLNREFPESSGLAAHPEGAVANAIDAHVRPAIGNETISDIRQMDSRLLAQDEERLRLGRELHDSTGQLL